MEKNLVMLPHTHMIHTPCGLMCSMCRPRTRRNRTNRRAGRRRSQHRCCIAPRRTQHRLQPQYCWRIYLVRGLISGRFGLSVSSQHEHAVKNTPAAQMVHVSFELAAVVFDDVPFSHRVQFKTHSPDGGFDHEPAGHGCRGIGGGAELWRRAEAGRE